MRTGYEAALFVSDTYSASGGESTLYEIEFLISGAEAIGYKDHSDLFIRGEKVEL
jgi:hypothetical protein